MKVIQITDEDAKALVDDLKLHQLKQTESMNTHDQERFKINEVHRMFHYVVVSWLQKHGANLQ